MANPIISERLIERALDLFERFIEVLDDWRDHSICRRLLDEQRLGFDERWLAFEERRQQRIIGERLGRITGDENKE